MAVPTGEQLVAALAQRDFARVGRVLAADVHVRALLPSGLVELDGSEETASRFERWFGGGGALELLHSSSRPVADVLNVQYRLRLDDHPMRPGSGPQLIEQHLFCRVDDGRISSFDLLCTGFRPADA